MPLLNLVVVLIVAGMALWLVNRYISVASNIKKILNVVRRCGCGVWVEARRTLRRRQQFSNGTLIGFRV